MLSRDAELADARARDAPGRLWVVLGDSAAQGVGVPWPQARDPDAYALWEACER